MAKVAFILPGALIAAMTAGCVSNTETQQRLASQWTGKQADEFFIKNGPPSSTYKMDGGGAIHSWTGGQKSYAMSGSSTTTFSRGWGGDLQATTTSTPSSSLNIRCAAQIVTDSSGRIQEFRITKDTIGAWQLSRCNEIFAK